MKNKYLSVAALALSTFLFVGCDDEDIKDFFPKPSDGDSKNWDIINFEMYKTGFLTEVKSSNGTGPIMVNAMRRQSNGTYANGNHAMIFNTHTPTGDDTDLFTGIHHPQGYDLSKVLIINQDMNSTPNDNQYGGTMTLDFSSMGTVTLHELTALDIDKYENMSYVRLYGANNRMLLEKKLMNMGNNSVQVVDLGNTSGVMRLEVTLDGTNNGMPAGSGAIDNIKFMKD
ncbi:hypothetical protein [Pontibacter akesuensis]|uniref:Lipoprotein n=1 Tax=Pontibacter akesuensis TaxID=388950 RepID=A0A1I7JXL1_9BACT|nr:hypothetical protein [Pontibacter akesuensis]GHA76759.1 hypothetical protein GCM10007389_33440 [Pontibacter akesuensis]SFU89927.1 hypothetical protein SAMN04487941_3158 [Pontibacter akesuensis]